MTAIGRSCPQTILPVPAKPCGSIKYYKMGANFLNNRFDCLSLGDAVGIRSVDGNL